jgi:hypothetical protein
LTLLLEASIDCLHFGDKGTTKNTHTQAKQGIIYKKKIDIYLTARYTPAESLLASRCVAGCERGVADFYK